MTIHPLPARPSHVPTLEMPKKRRKKSSRTKSPSVSTPSQLVERERSCSIWYIGIDLLTALSVPSVSQPIPEQTFDIQPGDEPSAMLVDDITNIAKDATITLPKAATAVADMVQETVLAETVAMHGMRDESSPEPDIPLSTRTKQAGPRSSVSAPSTPVIEQIEHPSLEEAPPQLRKLAPNIQHPVPSMPLKDVLRAVVMLRLQHDRQTQEERVTPVLMDNLSKVEPPTMPSVATPEDVIREVTTGRGKKELEQIGRAHV